MSDDLQEIRQWLRRVEQDLADTQQTLHDVVASAGGTTDAARDAPPQPVYADVSEWVENWFVTTFRRDLDNSTLWCPQWWAHDEAVVRLGALWRAWEYFYRDASRGTGIGTATAVWFRDFGDPQLAMLLSQSGPFRTCADEHTLMPTLPVLTVPAGYFPISH